MTEPLSPPDPRPAGNRTWRQERGRQVFFNLKEGLPPLMTIGRLAQRLKPYEGAIVTRRTRSKSGSAATRAEPQVKTGAVHDARGRLLPEFAALVERSRDTLFRREDPPQLDLRQRRRATELPGEWIYGGELVSHFGHFLLETLSRAWAFPERAPGTRILFHHDGGSFRLGGVAEAVFGWLGLGPDDIAIANKDFRVERLLVPTPLFDIQVSASLHFSRLFRLITAQALGDARPRGLPRKVYLTRRNIDRVKLHSIETQDIPERKRNRMVRKLVVNEAEVEELFRRRGFTVVTPELMPLADQIALWQTASHVAGVTGSALHGALFGRRGKTTLISLNNRLSANQVGIEELMDLPAFHIFCTSRRNETRSTFLETGVIERALGEIGL